MAKSVLKQPEIELSKRISDEIKTTTCYMCACRCGIKVYLKDGKVKYIEGNREHPVNKVPKSLKSLNPERNQVSWKDAANKQMIHKPAHLYPAERHKNKRKNFPPENQETTSRSESNNSVVPIGIGDP